MRVVVPYTNLRPETARALRATCRRWERWYVGASREAYWHLLAALWAEGETFCIVEHDVIVRPDSLRELDRCPAPWCAFELPYVGTLHAGLGCVKFSAELIRRHPDAIERIGSLSDEGHPPRHWCRLDAWISERLQAAGEESCVHGPPVGHLRDYVGRILPSHVCGGGDAP